MSTLTSLLRQVKELDPAVGADLAKYVRDLQEHAPFGLHFERHRPESVRLFGQPVRKGDKVHILPSRGNSTVTPNPKLWYVANITQTDGVRRADLIRKNPRSGEWDTAIASVEDLVVVAEFRDNIYPGLVQTGEVVNGADDDPFHTVINGENYHVLEALTYTHAGKIDTVYIDPPYNTGARDWKYSNDYVEDDDAYRHSKWLAFMERRLKVAKKLLNPDDSVLIVTIDEKEYLRLGMLLEQMFPEADIQMVSCVTNRAGSPRTGRFSRVDEYVYYVFLGASSVTPWSSTMLPGSQNVGSASMPTVWFTAVRRGSGASRSESKSLFYPVIIDADTGAFRRVGDPIPKDVDRREVALNPGELAIWPMGADGGENRWRFSASLMRSYFTNGTARLGRRDRATGLRPVTYLQPGTVKNIENGTFVITGRSDEGALQLALGETAKAVAPRTVWSLTGHFARDHGSHLIGALVGNRKFPFPKALYAVEDSLRFVLSDKPDAIVLDFFAGSGTTAHAVMRLNRQDGGRRQSIIVTNNEVGASEQHDLIERDLRPGDTEWESLGICDYITKPRITAAITGRTPAGHPVKGDYKFTDEFPMADGFAANARYFTLTYEREDAVNYNLAFARVAPLLWLRAGSVGRVIDSIPDRGWDVADNYGVLFDLDAEAEFVEAVGSSEVLTTVYIVTSDDYAFQRVASRFPAKVDKVHLYRSYLSNFRITNSE